MRGASTYPLADHTETTALGRTATTPLESNCEWVSAVRQFLHHQKDNAVSTVRQFLHHKNDNALTMPTMIYGLPEMMTVFFNLSTVVSTLLHQLQRLPEIIARTVTVLFNLSKIVTTVLLDLSEMATVLLRQPQRLAEIIARTPTVLLNLSKILPTVVPSVPELLTLILGLSIPRPPNMQNS